MTNSLRFYYPISPSGLIGLSFQTKLIKETRKALDPTNIERITRPKRKDRMNPNNPKMHKAPRKRSSMPRTKRKMNKKGNPRKHRNRK